MTSSTCPLLLLHWSLAKNIFLFKVTANLTAELFYFSSLSLCFPLQFYPPPLCDFFLSWIQLLTSCNILFTKENLYRFRRNKICIGCYVSTHCIFTKPSIWSFPAVKGDGTCFSITVSAHFSLFLNRALHSQVSSPRNSLTEGAGRVVTVMHGYTAEQRAGRLHGEKRRRGGEEMRGEVERKA